MQDRYTGDIGDYVKLAMLRRMGTGHRLGIVWWLYPDESHNTDGKHVSYLQDPGRWRRFDPELFDALHALVTSGNRNVAALEAAQLISDASFFSEPLTTIGSGHDRRLGRRAWFQRAREAVAGCDVLFLDPDNGLETANYSLGSAKAGKSVALAELEALRHPGRTIIVYHHQTRMAGGHLFELSHWGKRLAEKGFTVDALRASAFSARAFFILDATAEFRERAKTLACEWGDKLTWHPDLSR